VKPPVLHTHIEDVLPKDHKLAFESVYCTDCKEKLHSMHNECLSTWVEIGVGNFCIPCFAKRHEAAGYVLDEWAL